jgi:hypothetical protein
VAVIVGFLTMTVLVLATSAAVAKIARAPGPGLGLYAVNLVMTLLGAALGGYVAARLAPSVPMRHALALCALMVVMSALTIASARQDGPPLWWTAGELAVGVGGVLVGAVQHRAR